MKIKSIHLKDFKRFKELTVSGLPATAKLVVLVGPNGCGKSSLFDAIYLKAQSRYKGVSNNTGYYERESNQTRGFNVNNNVAVYFHDHDIESQQVSESFWRKAVYVRSAHRNDPSFSVNSLGKIGPALSENRFNRMIDDDRSTTKNYMRLISQAVEGVFETADGDMSIENFRDAIIADIREAVRGLFSNLILNSLGNPLGGAATFRFDKEDVKHFNYENLSGGEKAAFDLILDLVIKSQEYNDTVFCIDEPESHVGMKLQGKLLEALYKLIPENCQLWIATHSIGMMRKAHDLYKVEKDKVVFLNFDERNFDEAQEIQPADMNRALWESMHSSTLDDLADLLFPDVLYFCESENSKGFDAYCYNTIFAEEYPKVKFISVGSSSAVETLTVALRKEMPKKEIFGIRDRDNLHESEVIDAKKKGVRVLSRKNIEAYLLHDDVLAALCTTHGLSNEALIIIKEIRDAGKKNLKNAVKDIRNYVINEHGCPSVGGSPEGFLKYLAGLITPDITPSLYRELEQDIFGDDSAVK